MKAPFPYFGGVPFSRARCAGLLWATHVAACCTAWVAFSTAGCLANPTLDMLVSQIATLDTDVRADVDALAAAQVGVANKLESVSTSVHAIGSTVQNFDPATMRWMVAGAYAVTIVAVLAGAVWAKCRYESHARRCPAPVQHDTIARQK